MAAPVPALRQYLCDARAAAVSDPELLAGLGGTVRRTSAVLHRDARRQDRRHGVLLRRWRHALRPTLGQRRELRQPALRALLLPGHRPRSEEHTSELQSLMRISYAVFCLQKKQTTKK